MKIKIDKKIINVKQASSFKDRLIGLMGKKNITEGLFLPHTRSIHTFFMKDNIDIIMINKDNKIIYYQKNIKKNKIIIKLKAYSTIELPKNTIDKFNNLREIQIIN